MLPLNSNIRLAVELARRELEAKYKRSILGWVWMIATPLCLLGIYSLVFGKMFGIQWNEVSIAGKHEVGFILPFFVGLTIYLFIADVVNSSATLFVSNRTYVIRSSFPLWVLWLSNFLRSAVNAAVSLVLVLLVAMIQQRLNFHGFAWMVLALVNVTLFAAGLSLLLNALGPFIGDISEVLRLLLRVLFYATPITYPLSMIKPPLQQWLWLNPLTAMIEPMRSAIVFGESGPILPILVFFGASWLMLGVAYWVFNRVKGVIADVV